MSSSSRRVSLKRTRDDDGNNVEADARPQVKGAIKATSPSAPKRKVVNAIQGAIPRPVKKREPLNTRATAASSRSSRNNTPAPEGTSKKPVAPVASSINNDKVVVCMRIKPTTSRFSTRAYEITDNSLILSDAHPNIVRRGGKAAGRDAEYTYTFDTVHQFPRTTPELYAAKIAPMVEKAMAGFNSTVFAYGQTGSGKSYTMTGTETESGVIPCAIDGIFDAITADTERAFLLRVSYIEIYNESLRDLLNSRKGAVQPQIRTVKGKVFVDPLEEGIVSTPGDVVELLKRGNANRMTGATDWNERSSRSHAVFMITIESRPRIGDGEDDIRVSRLSLIDLAGSEKAVTDAERRSEGKHINQSLLALREVVHKLTEKGKNIHIPYRNSKLTHLLENVLGGDSNICVICTMSAEETHCAETLETLKFAGRCSQVETKAQKNILQSTEGALIRAKDMEIASLKRQLENISQQRQAEPVSPSGSASELNELADSVADLEARKSKLADQIAMLNKEILTSEKGRTVNGTIISPPKRKRPRVSDFTSTTTVANLGIGHGLPSHLTAQRRVASNVVQIPEDRLPDSPQDVQHSSIIDNLNLDKGFELEVTIASLRRTIAAKEEAISEHVNTVAEMQPIVDRLPAVESELEETKANLIRMEEQYAKQLKEATEQLEQLHKTQLQEHEERFVSVEKELAAARAAIEAEKAKVAELETELATAKETIATAQAKVAEQASALETQEKATADAETQAREEKERAQELKEAKEQLEQLEQLQKAKIEELETRIVDLEKKHAEQLKEAKEQIEQLEKLQESKGEEQEKRVADLEKELAAAKAAIAAEKEQHASELEAQKAAAKAEYQSQRVHIERLNTVLEAHKLATSEAESQRATALEAKRQAAVDAETRVATERELLASKLEAQEKAIAAAEAAIASERKRADDLAAALEAQKAATAEAEALIKSHRKRADNLAKQLLAASSAAISKATSRFGSRRASVPDALAVTSEESLQDEEKLSELARLDKVVTQQKSIIEQQLQALQHCTCQDEQNKQPTTPTGSSSPITRYGDVSRHGGLPSTFSSRNLALPTTPTLTAPGSPLLKGPSPLPMHTGQVSNALRTTRRVTVERDMGRLQKSAKVANMMNKFNPSGNGENESPRTPDMKSIASPRR